MTLYRNHEVFKYVYMYILYIYVNKFNFHSMCVQADWQALSHSHFEAIVSALRDLYLLPMLDPTSVKFGVLICT